MTHYDGPVADAFLHTPWLGGDDPDDPRGDTVDWHRDTRLARVMHTFGHVDPDGRPIDRLSAADLLSEMAEAGTSHALLPAKVYYAASEQGVRAVHRELAALVAASGGRLKAVATLVPPELGANSYWDLMRNVRLVREAAAEGFAGVHVTPSPWGMAPNDKWLYPVYAACAELGLAVFVHVGMPGPLWPMVQQDPVHLDEVALAFPELLIVAHHIGDPWTDMSVRLAARHPNLYLCTSAWAPKRYPRELVDFMASGWHGTAGAEKVLFASDFPLLDLQRATASARELPLTQAQLRSVLYSNMMRLFWPEEMGR